jgi:hypothetical protein
MDGAVCLAQGSGQLGHRGRWVPIEGELPSPGLEYFQRMNQIPTEGVKHTGADLWSRLWEIRSPRESKFGAREAAAAPFVV